MRVFEDLKNRFTLAFRKPITIVAIGQTLAATDAASRHHRSRMVREAGWSGILKNLGTDSPGDALPA
jgi:hypothetical protein